MKALAKLHLSDVEFRGETIYFMVLDRFHNGCKTNLGRNNDLNDPKREDWSKYWGGDLQGVLDKIDYLEQMGITSLWTTPLFEQVEAMGNDQKAPMHGYWTRDFKRINERWVNDPDEVRFFARNDTVFDRLLAGLHERNMKFILDVVCNHSSPSTAEGKGQIFDDGKLLADFNDDHHSWYHHYGEVTNWEDEWQVQNCELSGLATFNENHIEYRRYIKEAMKCWLDKGVDALRIDTVKHMPIWFWQEFNGDLQSHKPDLFVFGEWIYNHPLNERSMMYANQAGMSLLDFGFCQSVRQCLGENRPEGFQLVGGLLAEDHRYRGATELVTFFENHDMPRLQSLDSRNDTLDLALVLLLTTRGIPCLFYGCEQYLHNDTDGGNDPYNRIMMDKWDHNSRAYQIIKILSEERRVNRAVQWGGQWPVLVEPDVYAYVRRYRDYRCLTILNRSESSKDLDLADLQIPDGRYKCLLTGTEIEISDNKARVSAAARSGQVFVRHGEPVNGRSVVRVQVNGAPTQPGEVVAIIGDAPELGHWDLREAVRLECVNSNTWFIEMPWTNSVGKSIAYKYVIFPADPNAAPRREIRVVRRRPIAGEGTAKWRDVWEE